jgi:hypothetical protein
VERYDGWQNEETSYLHVQISCAIVVGLLWRANIECATILYELAFSATLSLLNPLSTRMGRNTRPAVHRLDLRKFLPLDDMYMCPTHRKIIEWPITFQLAVRAQCTKVAKIPLFPRMHRRPLGQFTGVITAVGDAGT